MTAATAERPRSTVSQNGIHSSIQNITPEVAEEWLGHNLKNRHVQQRRVNEYAEAIKRGEWKLTGDPIRFNQDGEILDGQHRLLAVIEAKKGIQSFVIRGLPDVVQDAVDTGAKRTFANVLQIRGYTDANRVSAAVASLHSYRQRGLFDNMGIDPRPGHQQLLNLLNRHPGIQESLRKISNTLKAGGIRVVAPMAAIHYVMSEKFDVETADEFFEKLGNHGYGGDGHKDPIVLLRKRLLDGQVSGRKLPPRLKFALVVKAFNAWMQGEEPENLRWRVGGPDPEAFPEIVGKDQVA